ncbi:30S ribosomal protein S16 [Aeromicrobium sp.]|nr:30S ribosomal protein S16 [Candidatus Saccharibacteria bacterium]
MLVIRLQRTGRKGHAQFRVVVQDSRRTPTSGKIVAGLGSYDPHAKTIAIDKEKASFYLEHGAQPSERVAMLLSKEGIKLPDWVKVSDKKAGKLRNPDKLRRNQEPEPVVEAAPEAEVSPEAPAAEDAATTESKAA